MSSTTPIPATMRAWQYSSATGGIERNLALHDSVPLPRLLGDSELLIKVVAASINPADYKVPELGIIARAVIRTPATPGMDFCGRVVQTARTVDEFAIGDLVFGRLDPQQHGTLGEYIVAPTKACAHVPDGVTPDEAAAVGVAGITEYQCIAPNVEAGYKILINGGSGGTGTFGIQIAKALGCHVTTTCSPTKADLCRSLGADEIIDYTMTDVSRALKAKGQVFSLVVDNAGVPEDLYKAADDFLLPDGRFVQVGGPMSLNALKTVTSRLLRPAFLGGGKRKYQMYSMGYSQADLKQLGQWIAVKKIRVVIEETYEFADVPRAFEKLKTGRNAGKLVVHVGK
ncbi:GroES-like protein [Parathielavia appendiculata]|uniref:GroES-like protein n=1 Tax=Parathielavia appendiculata TaxID=2587402 RepID=A0AAN6TQP6_9PEZI|nr:GroES-like protein [Parathielavia appendiculata]